MWGPALWWQILSAEKDTVHRLMKEDRNVAWRCVFGHVALRSP